MNKIKDVWEVLKQDFGNFDISKSFSRACTDNACIELLSEIEEKDKRIAELEKVNDTLHKLMTSGESRGVAKATEEFKERIAELEQQLSISDSALKYAQESQAILFDELQAAQPEWISVEDRLPDGKEAQGYDEYLTYNPTALYNKYSSTTFLGDKWDKSDNFITHWMLLPAPPEKG